MPCITVMGAERIGKVHATTVTAHSQARLVLVCDPSIEAAKAFAEPLGAHASADATEAFSADDVDAVVIGPLTPLHAEYVLAAARADKAVLCERPVASSVEVARTLADELATFEHLPAVAGLQRRYDPSIAEIQRLVAEGRIRCIEQLTIVSRDPASSSAEYLAQSRDVFKDMTIHDSDEAWFFLGEIVSANAIGQKLGPALADVNDLDGTVTTPRTASGAVAIIKNTRHCASDYDQKVEVLRPEDEVVAGDPRATSVQVNDVTESAQQEVYPGFFLERYADVYRDELTAFTDAVNNGSPVTPTVEDGVAAPVLAEAVGRSARSGQAVEVMK